MSCHLHEEGFPWLGREPVTSAALKLSPSHTLCRRGSEQRLYSALVAWPTCSVVWTHCQPLSPSSPDGGSDKPHLMGLRENSGCCTAQHRPQGLSCHLDASARSPEEPTTAGYRPHFIFSHFYFNSKSISITFFFLLAATRDLLIVTHLYLCLGLTALI